MVCHYQSKPLALNSKGKKEAEKDAKKGFKQLEAKNSSEVVELVAAT